MATLIDDLDHLMLAVFDHAAAMRSFEQLGFKVRPVRQLPPMGGGSAGGDGGSAAILLRARNPKAANYIELARADPRKAVPVLRDLLCQREGVAMMVHSSHDLADLERDWQAQGLSPWRVRLDLQPFDAGSPFTVDVVMPQQDRVPFMLNACCYSDRSDFEREEWRDHPNTALSWIEVTCVQRAEQFDASVEFFARLYGRQPQRDEAGIATFTPGHVSLRLMTERSFRARYGALPGIDSMPVPAGAGLAIEVRSFETLADQLAHAGIAAQRIGTRICVPPASSHGVLLEFVEYT